ncbi:unnamed protein product [Prorocentrum cordatum]|uniref:Uncharacterized protein n=1 Tax=Prorocentrum cordatum TaxID=2364126 RepID=A0ABN9WKP4_9DINO|nr:unnamed protein product [Polarella glacialis]
MDDPAIHCRVDGDTVEGLRGRLAALGQALRELASIVKLPVAAIIEAKALRAAGDKGSARAMAVREESENGEGLEELDVGGLHGADFCPWVGEHGWDGSDGESEGDDEDLWERCDGLARPLASDAGNFVDEADGSMGEAASAMVELAWEGLEGDAEEQWALCDGMAEITGGCVDEADCSLRNAARAIWWSWPRR